VTKITLKKNKIKFVEFKCISKDKLTQCFEMLSFGAYLSFYFALINKLNPTPIPWVDFFKNELAKASK
jgi:hypothetical protein